ncbi:hypothetical protein [Streptacidiphilus sp. PAMC 29251]
MLPQERVEQILALDRAGWSARAIADQLGHAPQTIRDYLSGRTTPGVRAPRPSLLTGPLARYCRQRFAADAHLPANTLFAEVVGLGFEGSRATFYRALTRHRITPGRQEPVPPRLSEPSPSGPPPPARNTPVLPRPIAPIAGETLDSYLTRTADASHLTLAEVLAVLPPWFTTKISNPDDRSQHHMLAPASARALNALARLTSTTPAALSRALPAFRAADAHLLIRATTACRRCTARRGIAQRVHVHLPAHHAICTRHGIWLSDGDQPQIDLAICPEIIRAQYRARRLLRRCSPQQLMLAQQASAEVIPAWPSSPRAIAEHWKYRLLALQTASNHHGVPTDHDAYADAAKYPDVIALAAAILTRSAQGGSEQDPNAPGAPQIAAGDTVVGHRVEELLIQSPWMASPRSEQ